MDLSKDKANSIATQIEGQAIIIAADSVVGKVFEKPKTKEEAFNNIKLMNGKVSFLTTGMTIKDLFKNKEITFSDVVEVHLRQVVDEEIRWYVEKKPNLLNGCGYKFPESQRCFLNNCRRFQYSIWNFHKLCVFKIKRIRIFNEGF